MRRPKADPRSCVLIWRGLTLSLVRDFPERKELLLMLRLRMRILLAIVLLQAG